jgi:hypothetical protein
MQWVLKAALALLVMVLLGPRNARQCSMRLVCQAAAVTSTKHFILGRHQARPCTGYQFTPIALLASEAT